MNKEKDAIFTDFLRSKAEEAKRELNIPLTTFAKMLNADGGYATAVKLISRNDFSDGFAELAIRNRLDLTVEALVVESEWKGEFKDDVLEVAERKLRRAGYVSERYQARSTNARLPVETLNKATPDYIWTAVRMFETGDLTHSFGPSTDYDLVSDDGRHFPPKAVFGVALSLALGGTVIEPQHFSGGESSACFRLLREAGYQVILKGARPIDQPSETNPSDGWSEGKTRLAFHLKRERSQALSRAKKAQFRRTHGKLMCERCKVDPIAEYGTEHAEACIEVHHSTTYVSEMEEGHVTTLNDLQCLCANCHRLVHRELRESKK